AAEDRGVRHIAQLFGLGESGDGGLDPVDAVESVDGRRGGRTGREQASAGQGLVVEQQCARPGPSGLPGGGQTGGTGTDDEDVGVDVLVLIGRFVPAGGEEAVAGGGG